ncbi:PD-(D/E)XK nuclease family protein [Microbacterium aurantiacum]|uniref:PD-(D/E)XK nuclease family protein n=1 Tax=Microbacterium aurantiacum TaxID=162393 RepID=UPI0007DA7B6D|nr:PD-(D/E)XK nuclease family protein [Microbacterium chocolatum]ANG85325.1 hypothetical protein A8L33_07940 [Microbacterium chocolatum]
MNITHAAFGAPALDALRALVADAQRDDALAPVTVIVRDNIAGLMVRRALARGADGRTGIAALTTATLPRLAEFELARAGQTSVPATTAALTMSWRAELAHEPLSLAKVADHPSTVRALVRAHRDLRRVSDDALDLLAAQSALVADVVALHRRVLARLGADRRDEPALIAAATELGGDSAHLGRLIDFLPARRTPAEQRYVAQLTSGDSDAHAVIAEDGPAAASEILHASDADDEVRAVTRQVLRALGEHDGPRLAVLYTSRSPYASLLHDRFAEAGIALNGPGVRPLRDRATADAFLTMLALDPADVRRRALFDWLRRAPIRLNADERITPPRSAWERISREAGVIGEGHWTSRLDAFMRTKRAERDELKSDSDASEGSIRHRELSIDQAEGLRMFVAELRERLAAAAGAQTWAELGTWALDALHRYLGPSEDLRRLPEDEQRAVIAIEQTLRSLADLDGALGGDARPTVEALRDIVEAELEARVPRVGRFGEGVFVGPVSAAASLDVDLVWVVGLSEDLYPGRLTPDPLLPERVRQVSGGALPVIAERVDDLRLALAAALAAPASVASFARGDLRRSTERLPSRWLMPSIRALAGAPALAATKWEDADEALTALSSNWSETRAAELPATEQELRLRLLAAGEELDDPVLAGAAELIEARRGHAFTRFDGNLTGVEALPDLTDGSTLISTTALEAYAKCPHAYFVERMLGVKAIETPEDEVRITPIHFGNLIHETMDDLTREEAARLPGYSEPWTPAQRERLRELARAKADDYEARGLTGHPRLWATDRASILADLDAMLDDDDAFRRAEDARVLASELRFGMRGIGPVHVEVASGTIGLRGSADRVDERRDGTLIVTDIKSGSARSFADIERGDPLVAGTKLQLPAYALAAQARYGEQPVTAQYWFVRKERGRRIAVPLDDEVSMRYREVLDTLADGIRSGIFPAKPPEKDDYLFVACPWCNPDGLGYGSLRDAYANKNTDAAMRRLLGVIDPDAVGAPDTSEGSDR